MRKEEFDNRHTSPVSVGKLRANIDNLLLLIALLLLGMMFLSMPLGAIVFYNGGIGREYTPTSTTDKLFAFVFGLPFTIPLTLSFSLVFAVFWFAYLAMMITSIKWPTALLSILRGNARPLENSLVVVGVAFSITSLAINLLVQFQNHLGIPSGGLTDADQLLLFIQATLAPLREEFGFRLSIIGVFAILIAFLKGRGLRSFACLLHPKKFLLNANQKILWTLNIASAIYFGISHIIYEPGVWQIGKVSQSVIAGLVLGWIYIEYGFFAAVLLHWSFNYFLNAIRLYEVSFGSFGLLTMATSLMVILTIVYSSSLAYSIFRTNSKRDLEM